ncbi:MAG TPA: hypothetical protein P5123_12325, partial [Spirochaetota bacterium]|nr:hypothetical protein [Spirochaetota bacterium]
MRKIIIAILFPILLLNCSKKSSSEGEEISDLSMEKESAPMTLSANDLDDSESETRSKKVSSSVKNDEELDPAGYNNFYPVEGRMLEYSVEMHFESENLVS